MEPRPQVIPLVTPGGRRRSIDYRLATEQFELESAFRLVYETYLEGGLTRPHPSRQRVSRYHLLPTTHVLVARCDARILATVTLVEEGNLGLPMESLYGPAIDALRGPDGRLAEVTGLAHCRSEEWFGVLVVERMMSLMVQLADHRKMDRLLIAVNPQHARFYSRIGFHAFDKVRPYPAVCGKQAIPMQLDLKRVAEDHPAAHRRFFGRPFPAELFRTVPLSSSLVQHFRRVVESIEGRDEAEVLERRCAL
jgi:hypothetical protein